MAENCGLRDRRYVIEKNPLSVKRYYTGWNNWAARYGLWALRDVFEIALVPLTHSICAMGVSSVCLQIVTSKKIRNGELKASVQRWTYRPVGKAMVNDLLENHSWMSLMDHETKFILLRGYASREKKLMDRVRDWRHAFFCFSEMGYHGTNIERITELKTELTLITEDVGQGRISSKDAADRIIHLRDEIDKLLEIIKTADQRT